MTDQKRDESSDIGFFREQHVTVPWCCVHPEAVSFERFVPHSDLVAAEFKTEKMREALDMLLDEINAAPLAIHGGNGDVKRFELALKVARESSNEGRP